MNTFNQVIFEPSFKAQSKKDFDRQEPYRHIIIDNFLSDDLVQQLYEHFPSANALKTQWRGLNEKKSESSDFDIFHESFAQLKKSLFNEDFYRWVSEITGIKDVFITDDYMGAGLHQGVNGSFLDVHIDFNIHHIKNVHRRLNMLIYLEKNWQESCGGHLEMWNADMTRCEKMVLPAFNRCVIFETNEISYHGYAKISIPENITRKSFFAYFYTDEREDAVPYHDTVFKNRPQESTGKKIKTKIKETVKNNTKSTLKKLGVKF